MSAPSFGEAYIKSGILSDQIQHDTMMKYTYISPNAACGLYYDVKVGEIQKPGEIQDCFITLIRELTSVAPEDPEKLIRGCQHFHAAGFVGWKTV